MIKSICIIATFLTFSISNAQEVIKQPKERDTIKEKQTIAKEPQKKQAVVPQTSKKPDVSKKTQNFQFGLTLSFGGVYLIGDNSNGTNLVGFGSSAGVFTRLRLSQKYWFQPEILYSLQGGLKVTDSYSYKVIRQTDFRYLNIPLLIKYSPIKKLNFEIGPQLGILLKATQKRWNSYDGHNGIKTDDHNTEKIRTDIKDRINSLDYGAVIGAGYNFGNYFEVGLRYVVGLRDVRKDVGGIKNSIFQVTTAYKF